jgi:hypothetical protein
LLFAFLSVGGGSFAFLCNIVLESATFGTEVSFLLSVDNIWIKVDGEARHRKSGHQGGFDKGANLVKHAMQSGYPSKVQFSLLIHPRDVTLFETSGVHSSRSSASKLYPASLHWHPNLGDDKKRKRDKTYSRNLLFLFHIFMRVLSTLRRHMIRLHLKVLSLFSICNPSAVCSLKSVFHRTFASKNKE